MNSGPLLLRISGLCKAYGPVRVLHQVGFDLRRGEVHALVGENGAGKSTLCRIIAGLTQADGGEMEREGSEYCPRDRRDAERLGVRMVLQELNLIGNLTVGESLFLDRLPQRCGWINYPELARQARAALARVGLERLDPERPISSLGIAQQQMVEIAAGLARQCDILILDEPTAALTNPEIEALFRQIALLKARGTAILYISHRLEEIRQIAGRVSVLRDGQMIATRSAADFPHDDLVRLMVGRDLDAMVGSATRSFGAVALEACGLRRPPLVNDVSFSARTGEILGFAGLMGSGRTETMRLIFGADPRHAGEILIQGSPVSRGYSPREAVRRGVAFLTEDRKEQGLILGLPVGQNLTLASLPHFASGWGWLSRSREADAQEAWIQRLAIRCRDAGQPVGDLSGGNQQKVVIAKWLLRDCDVLIFDEPTRGIDVGAKQEIHQLLIALAGQGKALIVVSSDLPELLDLCDRIAVMSGGKIAEVFHRGAWSQEAILNAALTEHLLEKAT